MPKVRDAMRLLEADGWRFKNQEGSHRHYVHPVKPGKVTVSGKPSDDVHPQTWRSILKQAGLREDH